MQVFFAEIPFHPQPPKRIWRQKWWQQRGKHMSMLLSGEE